MTNNIYIVGDTHGEWGTLNTFINKKNPDLILQVGDWGYWPAFDGETTIGDRVCDDYGLFVRRKKWFLNGVKNPNTKIHWCDGNHEDHWQLQQLLYNETQPNCFYQKRGSTITLPDGRVVLFIGGAYSIDKGARTEGIDWFREETISYSDIDRLPDCKVDIVISHTCPTSFIPYLKVSAKVNDSSCKALEYVLDKYKPKQWFYGHWHQFKEGYNKGCHWTCLNILGDQGGWHKLK